MIKELLRKVTKVPFFRSNIPKLEPISLSKEKFFSLLEEVIKEVTYKPNFRIRLNKESSTITISYLVSVDIDNKVNFISGDSLQINVKYLLNDCPNTVVDVTTKTEMIEFIFGLILIAELHEMKEFYKVGDTKPFDPHYLKIHTTEYDIKNFKYKKRGSSLLSRISVS